MARQSGRYRRTSVGGEEVAAFVPFPLPPRDPPLLLDGDLTDRLQRAEAALRRLDQAGSMVPSIDWFLYGFVRKEAVLSSQIEGTQATLVDLLTLDSDARDIEPLDPDLSEVCNYLEAVQTARAELAAVRGLPLSMRLLDRLHAILMRGSRGADKLPGEVRRSQNWIGGTRPGNARFVPPPPDDLPGSLTAFEQYLHSPDQLPALVRIGLLHVQFETIHPYLDGNGRIGRLLITLLLEHHRLLAQPLCYTSVFFKRERDRYYERLSAVRTDGDWEGWTRFFLEGIAVAAEEAADTARDLSALVAADRHRVLAAKGSSLAAARLFERLPANPIVTIAKAAKLLQATRPTAAKAIRTLVATHVLAENSGKVRDQRFAYTRYLDRLRQDTDLD